MIRAKKALGQNFLKSPAIIHKMIKTADLVAGLPSDGFVLEIGPGKGALTKHLLKSGVRVVAVEKDADMIPILNEKFADEIAQKQLTLILGDISSKETLNMLWHKERAPYKIIANIPYYITGEILRTFLEAEHQPESITLMVQREVAQRIVARDGKESILSISVKAYGEPAYIQRVPARLFTPAPKVDSAILHIAHISKGFFKKYGITERDFFTLLRQGFSQKRKQLAKNLQNLAASQPQPVKQGFVGVGRDGVESALEQVGVAINARAEELNVEQWGQLADKLVNRGV